MRGADDKKLNVPSLSGDESTCRFRDDVAGPGVEPGLRDYEPRVQPYTTPLVFNPPMIPNSRLANKFNKITSATASKWGREEYFLPRYAWEQVCEVFPHRARLQLFPLPLPNSVYLLVALPEIQGYAALLL